MVEDHVKFFGSAPWCVIVCAFCAYSIWTASTCQWESLEVRGQCEYSYSTLLETGYLFVCFCINHANWLRIFCWWSVSISHLCAGALGLQACTVVPGLMWVLEISIKIFDLVGKPLHIKLSFQSRIIPFGRKKIVSVIDSQSLECFLSFAFDYTA